LYRNDTSVVFYHDLLRRLDGVLAHRAGIKSFYMTATISLPRLRARRRLIVKGFQAHRSDDAMSEIDGATPAQLLHMNSTASSTPSA